MYFPLAIVNIAWTLTSLPVAPAADVECEEDGDGVLGPGDDAVEAHRLRLYLTVHGAVLVSLDVGAELRCRVKPTLSTIKYGRFCAKGQ